MSNEVRERLKAEILTVLGDRGHETSLPDLLDALRGRGEEDATSIKVAVWELIADHEIYLTPQRQLVRDTRDERQAALAAV